VLTSAFPAISPAAVPSIATFVAILRRGLGWIDRRDGGGDVGGEDDTVTVGAFEGAVLGRPSSTSATPPPTMKAIIPAIVMTSQVVRDNAFPLARILLCLG